MNCRNAVKLSDPGAPNTQATSENFGILAKATTHEHGKALNFAGRYTDQIAYSVDGKFAFIAGSNSNIYVYDTQTRSVVHTLNVAGPTAKVTSLAVDEGWLYVTEGNTYGTSNGRLMRINIDPMSQEFLITQQKVNFGIQAAYGFQDMAINQGRYMAITAPNSPIPMQLIYGGSVQAGNVYVIDLNKIDSEGKVDGKAVVTIDASNFPVDSWRGRAPQYVTSGQNDGEFLLSSAKSPNAGVVSIKVEVDADGNLVQTVTGKSVKLTPAISDLNWLQKKFQQNIQRAADTVIVQYGGNEYALVADYNFAFNDPHWGNDDMLGKQIGGKIGIIQDPFGKNGEPVFLGATTPIVGGAVEHLSLSSDGKQLYADVLVDEQTGPGEWRVYKPLFVWDASRLIQDALDARANQAKLTLPVDKIKQADGSYQWRTATSAPQRYNGAREGEYFGWTYGIGTYTVPGRSVQLQMQEPKPSSATENPGLLTQLYDLITRPPAVDDNATTRFIGITDADVQQNISAGNTSASSAAWYAGKVLFYNGWNFIYGGFVESQAKRTDAYYEDRLSFTQFATATGVSTGASLAGLVGGVRVGNAVGGAVSTVVGSGYWGTMASGTANAVASDVAFTFAQKGGDLLTYTATQGKWGQSFEQIKGNFGQITTDIGLNSGIVLATSLALKSPVLNGKVVWNSPSLSNYLPVKFVQPIIAADTKGLRWSLADSTGGDIFKAAGGTISRNGHTISIPAQGTLTLTEAQAWMDEAGGKLQYILDDSIPPRERASLAVQLSNNIVMAARNAMQDVNAAAQLNLTHPLHTYDEWVKYFGEKKGGNALYSEIMDAAIAQTKKTDACFVAGTLVHTKEGLVPIEKIKVGDYVLSKPESGEGEQSYQRVSKTFVHEAQEVLCVDIDEHSEEQLRQARMDAEAKGSIYYSLPRTKSGHDYFPLVVTRNHPFWVVGKGWVEAIRLHTGIDRVLMEDGIPHFVRDVSQLVRATNENIGWQMGGGDCPLKFDLEKSEWVDFSNNDVHKDYSKITNDGIEWWEQRDEDYMRCTVYNLEVENTHTYYVGELGVWVHNKLPSGSSLEDFGNALELARNDIIPPNGGTVAYWTDGQARSFYGRAGAGNASKNQGVISVAQKIEKTELQDNVQFQMQTEGSIVEKGIVKDAAGVSSEVNYLLEFSYLYNNPNGGGFNFIKSGDGRAKIYEIGGKKLDVPIYSKTTIDAKYTTSKLVKILKEPANPTDIARGYTDIQDEFVNTMRKTTSALEQNPGYTHVIEMENAEGVANLVEFLTKNVGDPKWGTDDWFSDKIFIALADKKLVDVGGGMQKRILSDNLIGFKKVPFDVLDANGNVISSSYRVEVIGNIENVLDANGKVIDLKLSGMKQKADILVPAFEQNTDQYVRDIVNLSRQSQDKFLTVEAEGNRQGNNLLTQADLAQLLPAAKQHWLAAGASAHVLDAVQISIADLPNGIAGQTQGNRITLDANGAGWGWFVDATPDAAEEFAASDSTTWQATPDSIASGKLDLLGILIHELGHSLGLAHDTSGAMESIVQTGQRQLPSVAEMALVQGIHQAISAKPMGGQGYQTRVTQYAVAANDTLTNGSLNAADGWSTRGAVDIGNGAATLREISTTQTRLSQVFLLNPTDRFLSFKLSGTALDNLNGAPDDAFEVALLNANTGASLLGSTGLTRTDAFLNLQADGTQNLANCVTCINNADGSRTYRVDLAGVPAGVAANLSFDLIGFEQNPILSNVEGGGIPQHGLHRGDAKNTSHIKLYA